MALCSRLIDVLQISWAMSKCTSKTGGWLICFYRRRWRRNQMPTMSIAYDRLPLSHLVYIIRSETSQSPFELLILFGSRKEWNPSKLGYIRVQSIQHPFLSVTWLSVFWVAKGDSPSAIFARDIGICRNQIRGHGIRFTPARRLVPTCRSTISRRHSWIVLPAKEGSVRSSQRLCQLDRLIWVRGSTWLSTNKRTKSLLSSSHSSVD